MIPASWWHWLVREELARQCGYLWNSQEVEILREDLGETLGIVRLIAHRRGMA